MEVKPITKKRGFSNPNSIEKIVSRYHIMGYTELIQDSMITSLTLPASNFEFEKLLIKSRGSNRKNWTFLNMICLEYDKDIYSIGEKELKQVKGTGMWLDYRNENVFNFLLTYGERKFNFIWLDLCSCLSPLLVSELENVVDGNYIADECVFSVTVQKAREANMQDLLKGRTLSSYRLQGFPRALARAAAKVDRTCVLLGVHNYTSHNKISAPMSIYTFLITNRKQNNL